MKTKVCSKCKIDKPFSEYFKDNLRKIGIRCKCKLCCRDETLEWRAKNRSQYNNYAAMWRAKNQTRQHATHLKHHYGLSIEKYNALLVDQGCLCKVCGKQHDPSRSRGRLYVDHCHKTGAVRALLCGGCNVGIGNLQDDPVLLRKAADYLETR
jgi:hypothetical protein